MNVTPTGRSHGKQCFCVLDGSRVYHVSYDVRADWWHVADKNGRWLQEFGRAYNRAVAACEPLADKAS